MTKHGRFKKAVRRHAEATGRRYTEALTDLEGLDDRMIHEPSAEHLLAHIRDHYRIDAVAATRVSSHKTYLFRIDRANGAPWIGRAFPPARPKSGVEGDAAILRFLERHDFPAERLAVDDAVSDFGGSTVLVTRFVESTPFPDVATKLGMMGDLLGRLHTLPLDESVSRPGGASGEDPAHEGSPRQDLMAALAFLDAVATKVPASGRERFEYLRDLVLSADDGEGLPEALIHGNLLHSPDHALLTDHGPIGINWTSAGRGPRLADFAWLMWGTWRDPALIDAAVNGYRQHIELTDEELDRFEGVMSIRPLSLAAFIIRRNILEGKDEDALAFVDPEYLHATAEATRTAFRR
ncbi:MAG: phosphotransferase enzyme family protein [Thermomicrobiales bacterium]